jgi:hypothetical protein
LCLCKSEPWFPSKDKEELVLAKYASSVLSSVHLEEYMAWYYASVVIQDKFLSHALFVTVI